jgi:hypothetical protein
VPFWKPPRRGGGPCLNTSCIHFIRLYSEERKSHCSHLYPCPSSLFGLGYSLCSEGEADSKSHPSTHFDPILLFWVRMAMQNIGVLSQCAAWCACAEKQKRARRACLNYAMCPSDDQRGDATFRTLEYNTKVVHVFIAPNHTTAHTPPLKNQKALDDARPIRSPGLLVSSKQLPEGLGSHPPFCLVLHHPKEP